MSYALSGNIPNPIPEINTRAAEGARVGAIVGTGYPWLDANLRVFGVSQQQSTAAADIARAILSSSGANVLEAQWVAGGTIHVRWKPSTREMSAVTYATELRDALLRAARERLGPNAQIILDRFRIEMPSGQDDLFVYPQAAGVALTTPTIIGIGTITVVGIVGTAFYFFTRRVRRNRKRGRR